MQSLINGPLFFLSIPLSKIMEINNKAQKKSFKLKWFHKFENLINNFKKQGCQNWDLT